MATAKPNIDSAFDLQAENPDCIILPAPSSYGVEVAVVPSDTSYSHEVQWAPDLAGAPDTGNAELLTVLQPGETIAQHYTPNDNAFRWYRARALGRFTSPGLKGEAASNYTGWIRSRPVDLTTAKPNPGYHPGFNQWQIFGNNVNVAGDTGQIVDNAVKMTVDFNNRLFTFIDEQGSPITRVLVGEVGGATNGWGIELRDDAGGVVMKTWGARSSTSLSLRTLSAGEFQVLDEGAAEIRFYRSGSDLTYVAGINSTNGQMQIYNQNAGGLAGLLISGTQVGSLGTVTVNQAHLLVGTATVNFSSGGSPVLAIAGSDPKFMWVESDQGANAKQWDAVPAAGILLFRVRDDADSNGEVWMQVTRSAATITGVAFPKGTHTIGGTADFAGELFTSTLIRSADSDVRGAEFELKQTAAASTRNLRSLQGYAVGTATSGTVDRLVGTVGIAIANGAGGTYNWLRGVVAAVAHTAGTVTNMAGLYVENVTGSPTNAYGVYVKASSATATTGYGIFIDVVSGASANNYGLYLNDPTGTGAETIHAQSGAKLTTAGVWTNAPSYARLKRQIRSLDPRDAAVALRELRPVRFVRKLDGLRQVHFIMDEYRRTMERHQLVDFAGDGIADAHLVTLAVAGWKGHDVALARQTADNALLRRRVAALEKRVRSLLAGLN